MTPLNPPPLGKLHLAELHGCQANLNDIQLIKSSTLNAAREGKLTVVNELTHQFAPHGITCVLVLAESHLSIHTWPEHNYVAIDLFTCNLETDGPAILEMLASEFQASQTEIKSVDRGSIQQTITSN